ncbi:hypothetical protein JCM33374_g2943 [Metschnikowia sp. JCM 33374]|nr:hypothetical protein JCM33374_g2943 [Metschnikowia sp. JCM 33374]
MNENKISIIAQPCTQEDDTRVEATTIKKLQKLVQQDVEKETKYSGKLHGEENPEQRDLSDYDDDGFRIPVGKIPLDGQFSACEMKHLVELSKDEGLLRSDVRVRVRGGNSIYKEMEIVEPATGSR